MKEHNERIAPLRVTRSSFLAAGLVSVLPLVACGGDAGTDDPEPGPPVGLNESEWGDIVEAANDEGELMVYSSLSGVENTFAEFEQQYPEIDLRIERVGTGDLITRIDQELEVGASSGADVALHSQSIWFPERDEENVFSAIHVSPEQQEEGWIELIDGNGYAPLVATPNLVAWNTDAAEQSISTVDELLEMEPTPNIGLAEPQLSIGVTDQYQRWQEEYGGDFFERLAELDPTVYGSNIPMAQALASGEVDYVIGATPNTLVNLEADGAPLELVVPEEAAGGIPYHAAIPTIAPNPNAAHVFMNWLLSEEGALEFVEHNAPVATVNEVEGSIPWDEVETPDEEEWTNERWNEWIDQEWRPHFD